MTLLPHENREVLSWPGPRYKCASICSVPGCSHVRDHAHHLWRRSFLAGDYAWVKLWDGTIIGNLTGLCYRHHEDITANRAQIAWEEEAKKFVYLDNIQDVNGRFSGTVIGFLEPQPPLHGEAQGEVPVSDNEPIGPAATDKCPACKRTLPDARHKRDEHREQRKRRKTWTVRVPDQAEEDGALVLDTLLESMREHFGHDEGTNMRYYTLVQALAWLNLHLDLVE